MNPFEKFWKEYCGVRLPDQLGRRQDIAENAWEHQQETIDRLLRGEFTEAEAAALIKAVVARQGLTRAQVETACWEWQERTFGPRKTDGTTSLVGANGFDGTYPTDQAVVPGGGIESVPGVGGGP